MFTLGQRPRGNPSAVWALSTTTTDAINREPLRMPTGAPAAPTPTDHRTAYPGGGASTRIMAVAIAIFQTARSPKQHENRGSTQSTEDALKTSIATPPSLFRGWHFRAPSAHTRDAESGGFRACAVKKKERLAAACT